MTPYFVDEYVTIYHGDAVAVMMTLTDKSVTHVITDPPYLMDYARFRNSSKSGGVRERVLGYEPLTPSMLAPLAEQFARLAQRWTLVFSDIERCHCWRHELEQHGLRYMRTGAWVRTNPTPQFTGDRPGTGFEVCTISHSQAASRWNGGGKVAVWHHAQRHGSAADEGNEHPTPKPVSLMRDLLVQFTDPGDTILDPFGGSGSTARAAKDLERKCILIEREERWCELAAKRMRQGVLRFELRKTNQTPLDFQTAIE